MDLDCDVVVGCTSHIIMQIRKKLRDTRTRGFQKTQVGSNDREFCGDGLEPHKDRRSRWVVLVGPNETEKQFLSQFHWGFIQFIPA